MIVTITNKEKISKCIQLCYGLNLDVSQEPGTIIGQAMEEDGTMGAP